MKRDLRNARWIGLALCASLSSLWMSTCAAGPLVLRGTATVATVDDGSNFPGIIGSLPFATRFGDTFAFMLSIESQQPAPDQPSGRAKFRATIGGAWLEHSQLEVRVRNNAGVSMITLAEPRDVDMVAIAGDMIAIRKPHEFGVTDYVGTTDVAGSPAFMLELGFLEYVFKTFP